MEATTAGKATVADICGASPGDTVVVCGRYLRQQHRIAVLLSVKWTSEHYYTTAGANDIHSDSWCGSGEERCHHTTML